MDKIKGLILDICFTDFILSLAKIAAVVVSVSLISDTFLSVTAIITRTIVQTNQSEVCTFDN